MRGRRPTLRTFGVLVVGVVLLIGASSAATTSSAMALRQSIPPQSPPSVSIDQAQSQADPATSTTIFFDVVFSESVLDFATGDIVLSGSAGATSAAVLGSGANYTVSVSGMTGSGTVVVTIPAGVARSFLDGLPNLASTSTDNTVTFAGPQTDLDGPLVEINHGLFLNPYAPAPNPYTTDVPIPFVVVFSEPVADFTGTDVSLAGTAGPDTAIVTGSGSNYTVLVSGMTQPGTVLASIGAGVAHDAAGNPNSSSTSTANTVEFSDKIFGFNTPGCSLGIRVQDGLMLSVSRGYSTVPPPAGYAFPCGQLSFSARTKPGGLVTFTIALDLRIVDYVKLIGGRWTQLPWDGETGVLIVADQVVTIRIRDNGRGDSDPTPGIVADPGAPMVVSSGLPATGHPLMSAVNIGAVILAVGALLTLASRRRVRTAS